MQDYEGEVVLGRWRPFDLLWFARLLDLSDRDRAFAALDVKALAAVAEPDTHVDELGRDRIVTFSDRQGARAAMLGVIDSFEIVLAFKVNDIYLVALLAEGCDGQNEEPRR